MLNPAKLEDVVQKMEMEVYPVTLIKLLLNRSKLLDLLEKTKNGRITCNTSYNAGECEECNRRRKEGFEIPTCRYHTSINRIVNANTVTFDVDTGFMMVHNEIFKFVDDKLFIAYCPHTKLVPKYTDREIRHLKIIVSNFNYEMPDYNYVNIDSSIFLNSNMQCWFNNDFDIITIPNDNKKESNFVLHPSK